MTKPQSLDEAVAPVQLVVAGLMFGIVSVLTTTLRIETLLRTPTPALERTLLAAVAIAWAGSLAGAAYLRRRFARELASRALDLRQLAEPGLALVGPYRRFVILAAALIEAPALFALTSYILLGSRVLLVVPAASLVLLLLHFPTAGRLREIARP